MARYCAISFEHDVIKVVKADVDKEGDVVVRDASQLPPDQLEGFLKKSRMNNFLVVGCFKELYQETFLLPAVDAKMIPGLVDSEIRRTHTDLTDPPFFYRVLGEVFQDNRLYKKVAAFIYTESDLASTVERFVGCRKSITTLYNATFALSSYLNASLGEADESLLCIADLGVEKNIFLIQNNQLSFSREIQSEGAGFAKDDVLNINMTIDYCFQSLRVKPARAILVNSVADLSTPPNKVMLNTAILDPPPSIKSPPEQAREYVLPLGAILSHIQEPGQGNILSPECRTYFTRRRFFRNFILALLMTNLVIGGFIADRVLRIVSMGETISRIRGGAANLEKTRSAFESINAELAQAMPLLTFINTAQATPDLQKTLVALNSLKMPNVAINYLAVADDEGVLAITVKGEIKRSSFVEMQQVFEKLVSGVKTIEGMEVTTRKLEIRDGIFSIEARKKN